MWSYTEGENVWLAREALDPIAADDLADLPDNARTPRGDLASRALAMPTDTNLTGDIFGGWLMSMMDLAGKMTATRRAGGRVVTVAVASMKFLRPVKVGDVVCCYTNVVRVGRTSITLAIETWALRQGQGERIQVTDAEFTFVAVDGDGRPKALGPANPEAAPALCG